MKKMFFCWVLLVAAQPALACSSFDLAIYEGWDNTGRLKGTVRLPAPNPATAADKQRVCVQFTTPTMKVFWGQWKCDAHDDDRFEFIQTLSSKPDAGLCDKTYRDGRFSPN